MLKKLIIPTLFSIVLVIPYEELIFFPRHWLIVLSVSFVLVIIESLVMLRIVERAKWRSALIYASLPIIMQGGALLGFSFLYSEVFQQLYVAFFTIVFVLLFYSLQERHQWHKEVYLLMTVIAAFLYSYGLHGFMALTGIQGVYFPVVVGILVVLLVQLFAFYQLLQGKQLFLMLCAALILGQAFWMLTFLPLAGLPAAVILATLFYATAGISLSAARKILVPRALLEYLFISAIIIVAVLLTSAWMPIG